MAPAARAWRRATSRTSVNPSIALPRPGGACAGARAVGRAINRGGWDTCGRGRGAGCSPRGRAALSRSPTTPCAAAEPPAIAEPAPCAAPPAPGAAAAPSSHSVMAGSEGAEGDAAAGAPRRASCGFCLGAILDDDTLRTGGGTAHRPRYRL